MIIARALRLIVLHLSVFELCIKVEVNKTDGMLAFASHHWQHGPLLTNERSLRTGTDQSEASSTSRLGCLLTNLMCKCCAWDGSDLPGSDPHQDMDPCHASSAGAEETLLSLSKQIISQVLSWKFVFSHTFTILRFCWLKLFQSLSLFLDQHGSPFNTFFDDCL